MVAVSGSGSSSLYDIPHHEEKEIRADDCGFNCWILSSSFYPESTPDSGNIPLHPNSAYAFKAFSDKQNRSQVTPNQIIPDHHIRILLLFRCVFAVFDGFDYSLSCGVIRQINGAYYGFGLAAAVSNDDISF